MGNYSVSRDLSASEIFISPETSDLTGSSISVTITVSGAVTVMPQYSTDGGTTWTDDDDGSYDLSGETDTRTITIPSGILRVVATETGASSSSFELVIIATTSAETGVVTTSDVYRTSGLTSSVVSVADVKAHILRAYSEARLVTGRPAGSEQRTEYQWGNGKKGLFLERSPIVTLDALTIGTQAITTSYVDVVQATGQIILKTTSETSIFTLPSNEVPSTESRNITATYTWGYFNVPYWYNRLVEIIAAIGILTQQMGGTFDDVTAYTVGDRSISKGEPFTNVRATMFELQREKSEIIGRYMKKAPAVF